MKVVIYELLMTEVWKGKLYPLLKQHLGTINSVRSYMTVSIFTFREISRINQELHDLN